MLKHYVNQVKLDRAKNVVKLSGMKPYKEETTNKVWGEAAKPAEVRIYERLITEEKTLLKDTDTLIDKIYEGLGGVIEVYEDVEDKKAVKAERSRKMTRRFA